MAMDQSSKSQWESLLTAAHAWQLSPDDLPIVAMERHHLGWLTPNERLVHQKFKTPDLRHAYLVSRTLCRATLSKYTGVDPAAWKFVTGAHGKPAIAGPRGFGTLRFNMTHTSGLVICIVTRAGEVGVDAEEITRRVDIDQVSRHFFSEPERASLASLLARKRTARFFEQWVLKEAYLKGPGKGLFLSPEKFTIEIDRNGKPSDLGKWQLALHRLGRRHVAATAIRRRRGNGPVPIAWFSAERLLKAGVAIKR